MIFLTIILSVAMLAVAIYLGLCGVVLLRSIPFIEGGGWVAMTMGSIFTSLAGVIAILVVRHLWTAVL